MGRADRVIAIVAVVAGTAVAQSDRPPQVDGPPQEKLGWLRSPFQTRGVKSIDTNNSQRLYDLLRAGNLYLSLSDAIALAIENNLDVQIARYGMEIAKTDLLRAKGGGTLRGVGVTAFGVAAGVGGPASPLITGAATGTVPATSVPTDIFDLGYLQGAPTTLSPSAAITAAPLGSAAGPPIPQYDPILSAGIFAERQVLPQNDTIAGGANEVTTRSLTANAGLQQGFSTGTSYSLTYNSVTQSSNSALNKYNPTTNGSLNLTVTQPLLRGFGIGMNRRWIRIAKLDEKISDEVFRQDMMNLVYGVSRLYYDLASLNEDLRVKRETLNSAQELLKNTQAEVEEGTAAAVKLTRARAQVAGAEQDVINARGLLEQEEALVKNVLSRKGSREPALQMAHIVITDTLTVPPADVIPTLPELIAQADQSRPDLSALDLELKGNAIAMEGTKNELLPELDVVATAQGSGLAGSPVMQTQSGSSSGDSALSGGYGTTLQQILSQKYPTYEVGIQLNFPIRNRVAQADYRRDALQKKAYDTQALQLKNQVALEIDTAIVGLRRARSAYEAAVRTRQLQQESLDVEKARYEAGVDTAFFVIQYQAYLSQAESTEVVAKGDYFKALAGLNLATGTLLDVNHVSLDAAQKGRVPTPPTPVSH